MGVNLQQVPRTADGRERVQPVTLDEGKWHIWAGYGDTGGAGGALGAGTAFNTSQSASGEGTAVEWQFRDVIGIAGASGNYVNAKRGDYIRSSTFAPATAATSTPGTGNANKVEVIPSSGLYIFVPAAGDGSHTITLNDGTAHPVPNSAGAGYWDYAKASKGYGTLSAGAGQSAYDLFDFEVTLVPFVLKKQMLGDNEMHFDPENVKPTDFLPEWRFRAVVSNVDGAHTVEVIWEILTVREHTS